MIVAGSASPLLLSSAGGYNLTNSLRTRSSASAFLNRTPASVGNRKTWTWSGWVKRGDLSGGQAIFSAGTTASTVSTEFVLSFGGSNTLIIGASNVADFSTSAVFRDPSSWYHIVLAVDTTQATAANRTKIWVNNVQLTFDGNLYGTQNTDTPVNNTVAHNIGRRAVNSANLLDGYQTEINFIDGQALTPSSFGAFSASTGVWQPRKYAGTYGTNGFYLPFTDNSALTTSSNVGLGRDYSGNGNYWTTNNISITAGATYDSMTDVPTLTSTSAANYAVLNPLDSLGGTVSNGNLQYTGLYTAGGVSQNGHPSRSTLKVPSSGKWYVEMTNLTIAGSGNSCMLGFTSSTQRITNSAFEGTLTPWIGVDASVFGNQITLSWNGVSGGTASGTQLFASYASGDIVNLAIDFSAGKIWVGKNGTYYNSGNPSAGTNETSTFTAGSLDWAVLGEYVASGNDANRSSAVANFGQRPFAYTPPTGFNRLNTFNLPTPTIGASASTLANKNMDISLWTGNDTGTTRNLTNAGGFQPDFVWIKDRTTAYDHTLYDSVRGAGNVNSLYSNTTGAQGSGDELTYGYLSAFNNDGFQVSSGAAPGLQRYFLVNKLNDAYVGWQWRANGAAVTNTAGSISSQVSANTSAGFSIVTYTGTGANATVGHGLGVAPRMIITKNRTDSSGWRVYNANLSSVSNVIYLNATLAQTSEPSAFNSTAPTSSVFSVGASGDTNGNGKSQLAYCFAPVAGYSAFGSYTGNGSADGPFVFTGFRPRYVLVKRTDASSNWYVLDSARNTFNLANNMLCPNLSAAEFSSSENNEDFLSNGFKLRTSNVESNTSGGTYIYMAFAETPQKFALAR